ncbi:Six-hairpin glycosidase [Pseudovirgaria hyperparasitica]|uniref:Six-hairpin glycosidase n=1 Tax=Pseudovirgaria hyperparasitica TaxID=470096 RepID=A0A6A6WKG6_9PEZI|nr:Six-hairpin glycosidase [Pseudovirgaria hyperparasitica]KAF2762652.1 Six-hairpin glycosidase [Pseudovirgaria hyperparasitica]
MEKVTTEEQAVIARLNANWIWVQDWIDSSTENTAGRLVWFTRTEHFPATPTSAVLHFSADTRYKLLVNGKRVTVGPSRSSPAIWFYDSIDLAPYLQAGKNIIRFAVIRYFASSRGAMPFERTSFPGLTVCGAIDVDGLSTDFCTDEQSWEAHIDHNIEFPTGLVDDVFLHIYERRHVGNPTRAKIRRYGFKTLNGDLLPWRLRQRMIPLPEQSAVAVHNIRSCASSLSREAWAEVLTTTESRAFLTANSTHVLDIQADCHSTAFLKWRFHAPVADSSLDIRIIYSEGYELEPPAYPFFRKKANRLDVENGQIHGPRDIVSLSVLKEQIVEYEPFWFRTFRILRIELTVGDAPVELLELEATQINYPLDIKAKWNDSLDAETNSIWDISVRTMQNCMLDGYSDCPFYEQLQYSMDSRAVGLFHYLLSGDDRLMRQGIVLFASSVTAEGLTQSRFPSHTNQLIAAFPLYWILQVCDHHLYFGDARFSRLFLPRIDGVLDFFDAYINEDGLVAGLPDDVWQFVDWVTTWGATEDFPDKGVPTAGRKNNIYTYFSMLLAHVLDKTAMLVRDIGRPGYATEYETRASSLRKAVRKHCYDGTFFTDSLANSADDSSYSQHCQVFAILSGCAVPKDYTRLLTDSFAEGSKFSKCSYMMLFYALRAFSMAEDGLYEQFWPRAIAPWRKMVANNLSTCEEDDVRQRSDCHAWSSVPLYEFCTELAGVQVVAAGASKILFKPRLRLEMAFEARVAVGRDNVAFVNWTTLSEGGTQVELSLTKAVELASQPPGRQIVEHGYVDRILLIFKD